MLKCKPARFPVCLSGVQLLRILAMSDPQPSRPKGRNDRSGSRADEDSKDNKRGLFGRIANLIAPAPENREELRDVIVQAGKDGIIDDETLVMIDGVVRLADMTCADVMVPASKVDMIDVNTSVEEMINRIITTGHSRFPVFECNTEDDDENRQNIIGILLAKDLLKLSRSPELNVRALLRSPFFVPESRSLNRVLSDFRTHHQHMALVVDEFGRVSGVLTIEDVLEEIVGEIEDEFYVPEDEGDIFTLSDGSFRVAGDTALERINDAFETDFASEDVDTIGGYIAHELGHVPRRGETYTLGPLKFAVLHTRAGVVRWFRVTPVQMKTNPEVEST